jgi:Leucine-rich repeat (LRR) protein
VELGGSAALFAQAGGKGTRGKEGMDGDAQLVLLLADVDDAHNARGNSAASGGGGSTLPSGAIIEVEDDSPTPVAEYIMSGLRTLFMLPAFHSHCRNSLNLSGTHLMGLPPEVGGLGGWNMRRVDLCNNKIPSLPSSIHQLKRLTVLLMHNNKLLSLPQEIGRLMHLHTLGLANNFLTSIPSSIGRLRSLRHLDLEANRLESLPTELGTGPVSYSLEVLIFAQNLLEEYPVELCRAIAGEDDLPEEEEPAEVPIKSGTETTLNDINAGVKKTLRIASQEVVGPTTGVPKADSANDDDDGDVEPTMKSEVDLRSMAKLQILVLSHNQLTPEGLPHQICRLPSLHTLLLHNNLLDEVPFLVRMGEEAGVEVQEEEDWDKELEPQWDHLGMPIPPPPPAGPKPPLQVLDLSMNKLLWWAQDLDSAVPPSDEEETANLQIIALCRMAPSLRHLDVAGNPELMELHMITLKRRLRLCEVTNTLSREKTKAAAMASRFKMADGEWEDEVTEEEKALKASKDARTKKQ